MIATLAPRQTSKPRVPKVNRSHRLGRGIEFCYARYYSKAAVMSAAYARLRDFGPRQWDHQIVTPAGVTPTEIGGVSWDGSGFGSSQGIATTAMKTVLGNTFSISIAVWPAWAGDDRAIFSIADNATSGTPWILFIQKTATTFDLYVDAGYRFTSIPVAAGVRTDICMTCRNGEWTCYQDGEVFGTYSGAVGTNGGNHLYVASGFHGVYTGDTDGPTMWSRCLSASEVGYLHRNPYEHLRPSMVLPATEQAAGGGGLSLAVAYHHRQRN